MADPDFPGFICILGATSAMAEATARRLAGSAKGIALVARHGERLAAIASDLKSRGSGTVVAKVADLTVIADPDALFGDIAAALGGLDTVLIFHGALGETEVAAADTLAASDLLQINFNSPALLALAAARQLEKSGCRRPVVLAIGSVAGDRGRGSNFIYGAAKGGLATLMQGLHHRLVRSGSRVRAVVVKPGFVDTPMTAGMKKGGPLWSQPDDIAKIIVRAMSRGGPIVYAPWLWRWILLIIRLLPQPIMDKANL